MVHFFTRLAAVLGALSSPIIAAAQDGARTTPPKPMYKPEPEYTRQAQAAGVQGTALFDVTVDENGKISQISLLSPIGFGLDEAAEQAISKWVFHPGTKDGKAVNVQATIEVNFRLLGARFDATAERRRTEFNQAVHGLQSTDPKQKDRAVKTMEDLARHKFPVGMYAWGKLMILGDGAAKDPETGMELIRRAAEKNYGPALYEVGQTYLEGNGAPKDPEKGLKMIRDAAVLGSKQAQIYLGAAYEKGAPEIPRDLDRARRYFRLCAAADVAECQFSLARLLFDEPNRPERDWVQAVAWLQLAADHQLKPAAEILDAEMPKLSGDQIKRSYKLKEQLVHKT